MQRNELETRELYLMLRDAQDVAASNAKKGGAEHTVIDFVGEIKDIYGGSTVQNVRDNVNIKLSDATAAELAHRPIEYDMYYSV